MRACGDADRRVGLPDLLSVFFPPFIFSLLLAFTLSFFILKKKEREYLPLLFELTGLLR